MRSLNFERSVANIKRVVRKVNSVLLSKYDFLMLLYLFFFSFFNLRIVVNLGLIDYILGKVSNSNKYIPTRACSTVERCSLLQPVGWGFVSCDQLIYIYIDKCIRIVGAKKEMKRNSRKALALDT